jgi:hypothetical protein
MQIPDDIQETLDEIFDDSPVDKQLRIKIQRQVPLAAGRHTVELHRRATAAL